MIRLVFEPHVAPRDEYESLLVLLRANQLATSTSVSVEDDASDEAGNRPAIRVTFAKASGVSFARVLFGWLNAHGSAPARLVLTRSGGGKLELASARWTSAETALALADFVEEESQRAAPGKRDDRPDGTTAPDSTVKPDNWHTDAEPSVVPPGIFHPGPGSVTGAPPSVRNTPPGPPFGDEDDEW